MTKSHWGRLKPWSIVSAQVGSVQMPMRHYASPAGGHVTWDFSMKHESTIHGSESTTKLLYFLNMFQGH